MSLPHLLFVFIRQWVKDASGAPAITSTIAPRQVVEHPLHENGKQDLEV
jgi:hypothetical protein